LHVTSKTLLNEQKLQLNILIQEAFLDSRGRIHLLQMFKFIKKAVRKQLLIWYPLPSGFFVHFEQLCQGGFGCKFFWVKELFALTSPCLSSSLAVSLFSLFP
jgi:hypothetical protein